MILFMEGDTESVTSELTSRMQDSSSLLEYERAAVLRDQIKSIERVAEEQRIKVDSNPIGDTDVIAMAQGTDETWIEIFFIRHGKLIGRDHFFMEGTQDDSVGLVLGQFVNQFYETSSVIPPSILIQYPLEDHQLIQDWLKDKRGSSVRIACPQRGPNRKLLDVVVENANQGLSQHRVKWLNNPDVINQAIGELQEHLSLPNSPSRMECYDISHIQGTNVVGSMVVFQNGKPKTSHYRRFKIKTVDGVDDYASMQEMLRRRIKRLADVRLHNARQAFDEGNSTSDVWSIVPELVIIDGGKGHLSAALEVFLELGLDDIPLVALAKENEEIFAPYTSEPIILPRNSQSLYLVQRIRDEAHRFAITYHRNLRSKGSLKSSIDLVTGIGPKRKRMLLRRFGSIQGIKEADIDDIAAVPGLPRSLAMRLKQTL